MGFDHSTGNILVVSESGPSSGGDFYLYNPTENTLIQVGKTSITAWGYGGTVDNFNSVKLDAAKNLVIGAGDSVKVLSQQGDRVHVYDDQRWLNM